MDWDNFTNTTTDAPGLDLGISDIMDKIAAIKRFGVRPTLLATPGTLTKIRDAAQTASSISGVPIVSTYQIPYEREQFRFPKSKKRRIRKKWAKDPRNWRSVERIYVMDIEKIQRQLLKNYELEMMEGLFRGLPR